jgi:hypothetical protein
MHKSILSDVSDNSDESFGIAPSSENGLSYKYPEMGYFLKYTNLGYFSTSRNIHMANKPWDEGREKLRELLKDLRKNEAGLTQVELSDALGKPQSYVSKYETGERNLDYVEITEICEALGVSMERFNKLFKERTRKK